MLEHYKKGSMVIWRNIVLYHEWEKLEWVEMVQYSA